MNILFVNYGDFTSNSLNHIGAFANQLTLLGHACVVAVPEHLETLTALHQPLFTPVTFARALESEPVFPNRGGADVVHAWTPRENVREFTLAYLRRHPSAALVIHLEDNEAFLAESFAREPLEKLRTLSDEELTARLSPRLSHPVRFLNFLRLAHGATYITDRLQEFIPAGKPAHRLLPGVDPTLYRPLPVDPALRAAIGVGADEKLIVYTGSTNFANLADVRTLLLALRQINDRGTACRLARTGIHPAQLLKELDPLTGDSVIDLGFIEKTRLGPLVASADVLVQPGAPDAFNDYRLPSKIPEFLSVGRPCVLPRANIGREMEDGRDALLLETGSPDEIAAKCLQVFQDPELGQRLGAGAVAFARSHFDLAANTSGLLGFYEQVKASAAPLIVDPTQLDSEDVLLAEGDTALRMRAKERSIAHLRQLADERQAAIANRDATVVQLQTAVTHLQGAVAELQGAVAESQAGLAAARREIQADQATITNLRSTITEREAQHARQSAKISYLHARAQDSRNQVEVLRGRLDEAIAAVGRFSRELDAAQTRTERAAAEVSHREDKIRRMQESFSWQVTTPLRALRRLLLDPLRRTPKAPRPARIDLACTCVIDEPADWNAMPGRGTIRGWLLLASGATPTAIRLRCGGRTIAGSVGLPRPDVAAGHPQHPGAARSGFVFEYTLPADDEALLAFEAQVGDARWRCFATTRARIQPPAPEHLRRDYTAWVRQYDTLTSDQAVAIRSRIEALGVAQRPLISIVMPTYNTPEKWLTRAIESVRAQLYPHWELCIADDASTSAEVRRVLQDFARRDDRIKVAYRDENGHISAASNSALALATGEYVALLDHDDELPRHALSEVVFALAENPQVEFLYSDEDKIDEQGRRFDPYFKPDWNPDLLLGQNYTCHLSVFRTARLRAIGGFRVGYEGSQDWDLTLRAVEGLDPAAIRHLPRVLYHWRAIAGSTALAVDGKQDYPALAAKRALTDHLERTHTDAELVAVPGRHWRVKRRLPMPPPKVSLIIPTHNGEGLLRRAIGSILAKTTYPSFEIVVVDNRSDDPRALAYFDELRSAHVQVLEYDAPFNFSAINNHAARHASGTLLAFLNNDLEVITPDWLDEMASQALRPEIGCVGAMLYYPNDTVQHAGAVLGLTGPAGKDGVAGHAFKCAPRGSEGQRNRLRLVQNYSAVTAACLVVRRSVFEQVGGFDEQHLAVAFNDIDFCLRVRAAGYRNLWTPFAEFYHHESASRGLEDTPEKVARFQRETAYMRATWGPLLDRDPAYNRNLSLQHEDFSLAFPPR